MSKTQETIKAQLRAIQLNPNISPQEKNRMCQAVLSASDSTNSKSMALNLAKECTHYKKKCSRFVFDCCNLIDPCNRCHLERECCKTKPPRISSITCNVCEYEQEPSSECIQCTVKFSKSHCSVCKIWTEFEIFHCDQCTICRVGKAESYYHCYNCDACFSVEARESHRCAKSSFRESLCSYCLDSIHTSQLPSVILDCCKCVIHQKCMETARQKGDYRCPSCRKSQYDMDNVWEHVRHSIRSQPLPTEMFPMQRDDVYRTPYGLFQITDLNETATFGGETADAANRLIKGRLVEWELSDGTVPTASLHLTAIMKNKRMVPAWCNDCERKGRSEFHFLGLECQFCKGFNTSKG